MSIQSEITRLSNAKTTLQTWLTENGVTVPEGTTLDGLVSLLGEISVGEGDTLAKLCSDTLTSLEDENITSTVENCFYERVSLKYVRLPNLTNIARSCFDYCSGLEVADFTQLMNIEVYGFRKCTALTALVLRSNTMCTLASPFAFLNCPRTTVYVPSALLSSYKGGTNWSEVVTRGYITFEALEGSDYE